MMHVDFFNKKKYGIIFKILFIEQKYWKIYDKDA